MVCSGYDNNSCADSEFDLYSPMTDALFQALEFQPLHRMRYPDQYKYYSQR